MPRIPQNFQSQLPSVGQPTGTTQVNISTRANQRLSQAGEQLQQLGDQLFQQRIQEQAAEIKTRGSRRLQELQNQTLQDSDFRDAPEDFRQLAKQEISQLVKQANPTIQEEIRTDLAREAATITNSLRERSIELSRTSTKAAVKNRLNELQKRFAQVGSDTAAKEVVNQIRNETKKLSDAGLTKPEIKNTANEAIATAHAARVQNLLLENKTQQARQFLSQSEFLTSDQKITLRNRIEATEEERNEALQTGLQVIENHFAATNNIPQKNIGPFDTLEEFKQAAEGTKVGRDFRGLQQLSEFMKNLQSQSVPEVANRVQKLRDDAQRDPKILRRFELAKDVLKQQRETLTGDDPYTPQAQVGEISPQPQLPFNAAIQGDMDKLTSALSTRVQAHRKLTKKLTGQTPENVPLGQQVPFFRESEREELTSILNSTPASRAHSLLRGMSKVLGEEKTVQLASDLAKKGDIVGLAAAKADEAPEISRKLLQARFGEEAEVTIPGRLDNKFQDVIGQSLSQKARERVRTATDALYKTLVIERNKDPAEPHPEVFEDAARMVVGGAMDRSGNVVGGPAEVGGRKVVPPMTGISQTKVQQAFRNISRQNIFERVFPKHANGLPARIDPTNGEVEQLGPEALDDIQPRHIGNGRYTLRLQNQGKAVMAVDPKTGQPKGPLVLDMRSAINSQALTTQTPSGVFDLPIIGEVRLDEAPDQEQQSTTPPPATGPGFRATDQEQQQSIAGPGGQATGQQQQQSPAGPGFRATGRVFNNQFQFAADVSQNEQGEVTVDEPNIELQDRAVPKTPDTPLPPDLPEAKRRNAIQQLQAKAPQVQLNENGDVKVPDSVLKNVSVERTEALPRGIRNNNPLNVKQSDIDWRGTVANPSDPTFEQFTNPVFGIRAAARDLLHDHTEEGKRTVKSLISEWSATDEEAYIDFVSQRMGVSPTQQIDLTSPSTLSDMVKAMIEFENGVQPYSEQTISTGLSMAISSQPGD